MAVVLIGFNKTTAIISNKTPSIFQIFPIVKFQLIYTRRSFTYQLRRSDHKQSNITCAHRLDSAFNLIALVAIYHINRFPLLSQTVADLQEACTRDIVVC